jgi:ABC-type transport system involved in cytochrome c biogenesis permease subunit
MTSALSTTALFLLLASALLDAISLFRGGRGREKASTAILAAAAAALAAAVVARSVEIGFPALTGTFESLVFYAAATAAVGVAYRAQKRFSVEPALSFGITVIAAAFIAIASSPIAPKDALAPVPVLRSFWLVLHVSLSIIGEALFALAFVTALASLLSRDEGKRLERDRITYAAIAIGYPVFTAGALVFGAIWAESAWGSWWSWDPKETWAAVTWLVYTLYLHLRLIRGRKDRLPALVAVIGFLSALFTFFGVNFLLPGLHSYK